MRILIVEDEPKAAAYIRKGLTEHGFIVEVSGNGSGGVHLATSAHYDLVLLDVMLPVRRRVSRGGQRIDLTTREYALLDYFVRHQGEVVSRTLITEHVWDIQFDSDTNVVDVAVRRLRAKIDEPFADKLIHTIRGVGYLFESQAATA